MKILLLGTGGTIAGVQKEGVNDDSSYTSGVINISDLLKANEEKLSSSVTSSDIIVPFEVCNLNSDDITYEHLIDISNIINKESLNYDGIIITHGTDTLEESAFFLNHTTSHKVPVVITCAMYPATSMRSDGPGNLLLAVEEVKKSIDEHLDFYDIVIAFNHKIIKADNLLKSFSDNEYTFDDSLPFYGELLKWNKTYEINENSVIPYVPIAYFSANASCDILYYFVMNGANAIVLAGAGAGEYSIEWIQAIDELAKEGIIFIRTSKISKAPVNNNERLSNNTISGGSLSPEKASIITSLHLMK